MAVDWTKPIEAVNRETDEVIPMEFARFDTSDKQPMTVLDVDGTEDGCWKMNGAAYFDYQSDWSIRNVAAQGRTFAIDHRDNTELHKLYVERALDILETVSDSIARLDDYSNWNASQFATELRKTRAKLVKEDAAFFEAAAISYAGRDWLDAEKE